MSPRTLKLTATLVTALAALWACPFDTTLREYLNSYFWSPFARQPAQVAQKGVRFRSQPFAGMIAAKTVETPLEKLRAIYQDTSLGRYPNPQQAVTALAGARAQGILSAAEREEIDLIDAKLDMRMGEASDAGKLASAQQKLLRFLRTARNPAYQSEARGWLARTYYLQKKQSAAGKIYLDELNRSGSNLSRETLINSLSLVYGYNGGEELGRHIGEYFDTPEHAAFAIQIATNPMSEFHRYEMPAAVHKQILSLLEKNRHLFRTPRGAGLLAVLSMRTALRNGDPATAIRLAAEVPPEAPIRKDPDYLWMLGSANYLSNHYAEAAVPLLALFDSRAATIEQRAAAAYGLCGVYSKTEKPVEQIRFALWLYSEAHKPDRYVDIADLSNQSLYWAYSGFDVSLLLEYEASIEALREFLEAYPKAPDIRKVKYALAVRLARTEKYEEAADLFNAIGAPQRTARMRRLAKLFSEAANPETTGEQRQLARFRMAEYIAANQERLYFNNDLWGGYQRYALDRGTDRKGLESIAGAERKFRDDQEERWRAYLLCRQIVEEAPESPTARRAANLALSALVNINSERFGRADEIRKAVKDLTAFLQRRRRQG